MFLLAYMMISPAKPNPAPSFPLPEQPVKYPEGFQDMGVGSTPVKTGSLNNPAGKLKNLKLPSVFSDHMVLQQKTSACIWGWAEAKQKVSIAVSWSHSPISVHANEAGKWLADIRTPPGGGPYEIEIATADEALILRDVLVGEVWLCSGQSNMVWGAAFGHQEMLDELPNARRHETIRLFHVTRNQSAVPLDTLPDTWLRCDSSAAAQFSAIGYFTAKMLSEKLDVPIGIISSCAGSTTVETWTPADVFDVHPELKLLTNHALPVGTHWNAMIQPLVSFAIRGVFWYQGEGNVISYPGYGKLLGQMVHAWREAWGYEFPFFQVQIAPYAYESQGVLGNKAAFLREQQVRTLATIPKTGLVVTTDLVPDLGEIHPPKKKTIAARLASLALAEVYGWPLVDYKSPVYARHTINGQRITVHFDGVEKGLRCADGRVSDLFIAGQDSVFHPAEASIAGNHLHVFSPRVAAPVAVRFGFTDTARPNLVNVNGMPVSPFRTDDWDIPY